MGDGPPSDLSDPDWNSMTVHVTDPTKKSDFMVYKVSIREERSGSELASCWRRFREFEEAFKALRKKSKELGLPHLPEPPPKKTFGRFDPKFVEERRRQLEDFLAQVKHCNGLNSASEFRALLGLFGGGGYLRKLGARTVAFKDPFKTRWFEIRGDNLHYHEKQGGKRLGTIPLKNTKVVDCTMYRYAFCLMGPSLPRTYVLTAAVGDDAKPDDCEKEKQRWWKYLEAVTSGGELPGNKGIGELEGVEDADMAQQYYSKQADKAAEGTDGRKTLGLKDFDLVCVVGIGSFGKVMKVKHRESAQVYAMKVLNKDQIIQNKMVAHTNAEKMILEMVNHPFVVNLHYAFQVCKSESSLLDMYYRVEKLNKQTD